MNDFAVAFVEQPPLGIKIDEDNTAIGLRITEGGDMLPFYAGPYEYTPDFDGAVLETKNKSMLDDVTIRAIPISRTTNPQGGKTVYIGEVVAYA